MAGIVYEAQNEGTGPYLSSTCSSFNFFYTLKVVSIMETHSCTLLKLIFIYFFNLRSLMLHVVFIWIL